MTCKSCGSDNQRQFDAEINIHFPGREGLDKPAVLVFSNLLVCLRCGFTEFTVTETELHQLEGDAAA
jgi:predicted nucleic-acid-binding Zn-ribbon protein